MIINNEKSMGSMKKSTMIIIIDLFHRIYLFGNTIFTELSDRTHSNQIAQLVVPLSVESIKFKVNN